MHNLIRKNIIAINELCEKNKVSRLFAFGSIVTGGYSKNASDVDIYVELLPMSAMERGEALINLWDNLERLFNTKVDLVTDQPLRNQIFHTEMERTKQLIYDREKQEILV